MRSQREIATGRGRRESQPLPVKTMLTGEGSRREEVRGKGELLCLRRVLYSIFFH